MLSAWGMRKPKSDEAARAAGYVFLLSTLVSQPSSTSLTRRSSCCARHARCA